MIGIVKGTAEDGTALAQVVVNHAGARVDVLHTSYAEGWPPNPWPVLACRMWCVMNGHWAAAFSRAK